MKILFISNNKSVIVDDDDYNKLSSYKWTYIPAKRNRAGYAARWVNRKPLYMHRQIMNCPDNLQVDHKNNDGLDNRKENLRVATLSQNFANRHNLPVRNIPYRGVYKYKDKTDRWIVHIKINQKAKYIGIFYDLKDAARAYDKAALEHFGEFAILNFPICNSKLQTGKSRE